jgi:hypothetical protein
MTKIAVIIPYYQKASGIYAALESISAAAFAGAGS